MKKKILWGFLGIVFLVGLIYLFFPKKVIYEVVPRKEKIAKEESEAYFINNTVVGWIRIQGTNIDYPVLQHALLDDSDITYNYVWQPQYEEGKLNDRSIVYGHNILNVSKHPLIGSKDHKRFEQLMGFVYYDFAKENQFIQYSLPEGDYLFRIYAVSFFKTDNENVLKEDMTKDEKKSYIKANKEQSFYDYKVDVDENDNLITLITCTRFFGNTKDYQFKVEGRLLREKEKAVSSTVRQNKKNYDEIEKKLKEGDENEKKL